MTLESCNALLILDFYVLTQQRYSLVAHSLNIWDILHWFVMNGQKCGMKWTKSDGRFGGLMELYYFCNPYEPRTQRNPQHAFHKHRLHRAGNRHLQALRTRSVAVAGIYPSAEPLCTGYVQLPPDGSHSAIRHPHATLLRPWRQLYHQPQSSLPMY